MSLDKVPRSDLSPWISASLSGSVCLLASLSVCWPLCLSVGLSVCLLASLSVCWPLCPVSLCVLREHLAAHGVWLSPGKLPLSDPSSCLCRCMVLFVPLLLFFPLSIFLFLPHSLSLSVSLSLCVCLSLSRSLSSFACQSTLLSLPLCLLKERNLSLTKEAKTTMVFPASYFVIVCLSVFLSVSVCLSVSLVSVYLAVSVSLSTEGKKFVSDQGSQDDSDLLEHQICFLNIHLYSLAFGVTNSGSASRSD